MGQQVTCLRLSLPRYRASQPHGRRYMSISPQARPKELLVLLGYQHVPPVIHLSFNKLGVIALQFKLQVAFFQFENIFAHGGSLSILIKNLY